jgi:hypothetical protein
MRIDPAGSIRLSTAIGRDRLSNGYLDIHNKDFRQVFSVRTLCQHKGMNNPKGEQLTEIFMMCLYINLCQVFKFVYKVCGPFKWFRELRQCYTAAFRRLKCDGRI